VDAVRGYRGVIFDLPPPKLILPERPALVHHLSELPRPALILDRRAPPAVRRGAPIPFGAYKGSNGMGGGNDSFTKLLLHGDGSDGSTTITDSSPNARTVSRFGNAQIDTAQSKFGGASILFDGSGDYLTCANSADFDFGTGDFCIDFWIRRNGNLGAYDGVITSSNGGSAGWGIYCGDGAGGGPTNGLYFEAGASLIASGSALANTTWTHVAVIRYGTTLYMYYNGSVTGSGTVQTNTINSGGGGIAISRVNITTNGGYIEGWLDEFRISKGTARWAGAFTPPAAAYS